MHLPQVVHVGSYLLHEHCDELHVLQLSEKTILLLERCLVFVVVRQLPIDLMPLAVQIIWGNGLVVHHHHTLSTALYGKRQFARCLKAGDVGGMLHNV